ncbi:MAG TPA: GvpL/GvpF family gas vesicle protein [Jatrophihabitans sp.]
MSAPTVADDVLVVFGIVGSSIDATMVPDGVEIVPHETIAAVVAGSSAVHGPAAQLRRHDEVVNTVVARGITMLPMRFGTAVTNRDDLVREVLEPNLAAYDAALADLAGFVQYTVRVGYVEDAVVAAVLRDDPRAAALREATRRRGGGQGAQISLGKAVADAIERRRPHDIERIAAMLRPASARLVTHPSEQSDRLADFACLVHGDDAQAFEAELERLAEHHHQAVVMALLGPLAPYDFVPEL